MLCYCCLSSYHHLQSIPASQWFTSYCTHVVHIRVANDAVVYSTGMGDVILTPTNASLCPCRLSHVLHVLNLQNNLFAVLHLTSHHQFCVMIEARSSSSCSRVHCAL
jgi:hypothetical protein